MKKIILALLVATVAPAMAAQYVAYPQIGFGSVLVSVDGLCATATELKTVAPVSFCAEWSLADTDSSVCAKWATEVLSTPINYSYDVPSLNDTDTTQFTTVSAAHALSYSVDVYDRGAEDDVRVGSVDFTIPACAK
jgi:hypothetical protein